MSYKDTKNRQMELMLAPARERLMHYSVEELCRKGHITFSEERSAFLIPSMGEEVWVHFPDFVIEEELEMWRHLTLLQYMDTGDGSPLAGDYVGLTQMRGGLARGAGFDKDISNMFKDYFKGVTAEEFRQACLKLGGELLEGKADVSVRIPYAPMFPVLVNFWEEDEDFPASGKTLVDREGEHYLTIEAAGGACSTVVQALGRCFGAREEYKF